MNQQNRGASSCAALELPMKRKRGRPRKDKSPEENDISDKSEMENMTTQPAQEDPIVGDTEDDMVGQAVFGVLEGSFDAGYFITMKAGSTGGVMKGVIFLPSKITPLTAVNDVAPQAKLYTRKNISIPAPKPHIDPQACIPQLKQDDQPSVGFDHGMPTAAENPVSIIQAPGDRMSLYDRTSKSDNHLHAGAAVGVPNPSASVMPQAKDSGREEQKKQFKIGPQPSVEKNFEFSSALSNHVVPNVEMGSQAVQIQDKSEKFDARVENIVQPDPRSSNDKPNTCRNSDNPEEISNKQGTGGEVPVCPNKDTAKDTQRPCVSETLNRDGTSCCNQKPVNQGTDSSEAEPGVVQSISLSVVNSQAELITSEDKQGTNENCSTVDAQISSTSGPSMNVECAAEAVAPSHISADLCQQTHQSTENRET